MKTNTKWLIGIGIALLVVVMFALPFIWQAINPAYGYGMMGGYGGRGSMMGGYGGSPVLGGMMGFGFGFMWLIPLSLIALIGLSIAALIKYLRSA
jgi:hypothetical protein